MKNAQHTPGPWIANRRTLQGETLAFHVCDGRRGSADPICEKEKNHTFSAEEMEANARLLAAAPELLDALKSLEPMFGDYISTMLVGKIPGWQAVDDKFIKTRAVIAKATGQSA